MQKAVASILGERAQRDDERGDENEEVEVWNDFPLRDERGGGAGDEPEEEEEKNKRERQEGRETIG